MGDAALKSWELENAVKLVDPTRDALYVYDAEAEKAQNAAAPWRSNPRHFQSVRISAIALLKMVMHARSGGSLEVMGMMQGYVSGTTFIVTDAFRLPVEGTETRVNAQDDANEYLINFFNGARQAGQTENIVGWYHSHPGYGCWLSGIDVRTQMNQQLQGAFVAVVIDPDRTISAGRVEIGAFRTFPEDYKPEQDANGQGDGFEAIPLAKIEDFGAYSDRYYSLEVSTFKSSLDARLLEALWNKYWVGTLSSSPLFSNRDYSTKQISDLAMKIRQAEKGVEARSKGGAGPGPSLFHGADSGKKRPEDSHLEKIVKAGTKIAAEEESGLMAAEVKEKVFTRIVPQQR